VFKVEREEAVYLYEKVKRDYVEAYQPHTDKCKVMDVSYIERIIRASNEDVNQAIESYVALLVEQLKPEYIKSLRASLRSVRARNKRLGESKVSSVTVDVGLINSLNEIKTYYPDQKLTNADVIKLAVEALHKELANT
jgi:DNA primase large subunit